MTDTVNAPERDNMPDTIMAWPDFDGCITGAWSANQYSDERAREYISRAHCDELVAAAYLDAAQRIEQCLWTQHWYLDGESVDPEDLSEDITSRTPDDARAALIARDERMKADGAREAQLRRLGPIAELLPDAVRAAEKAMVRYPQPNYVISKWAEETGEVTKDLIHVAEGRQTFEKLRGEIVQSLAMLHRLLVEGDQIHGLPPIAPALQETAKEDV